MLPDHWEMVTLAEVADYRAGRTPARADTSFWEGDDATLPWVSISDMAEHQVVRETKEKITQKAADIAFRGRKSPAGTLLMSFKLTIGRVATLGMDAFHNEAIISIFPRKGIDQRYLGYWLSQVDYDRLHDRQIKGNTLNKEKIDRIPVARPPEEEQANIADVLDAVHSSILIQNDSLATAIALKRATMRELFTRGVRDETQKDSEIGPVPESWEIARIGDVATRTQYGMSVRGQTSGRYPILRMNCQEDGKVVLRNLQYVDLDAATYNSFRIERGDILFNRTNSIELVGRTAIFEHDDDAVFASYLVRLTVDQDRCLPRYLNHFMNWPTTQAEIKKLASRAVGQANINASKLRTVAFPLPPTIAEQQEIVAILDAIDGKIDLHRRKKAVLEELFRSLLHKLMTGEIRVSDLDLTALEANQKVAA